MPEVVDEQNAVNDSPAPPPGYSLEPANDVPPPPPGFALEKQDNLNSRLPFTDDSGKLHTASHSRSDDAIWEDVQADKAKDLPKNTTPLGGNPLGPGSVGYKAPAPAPPRPQLRFTDVWYPRVSTEAQAGAARASSPRATASKAAGMPLADVAGAPHDPQLDVPTEYNPKTGMPFKPSLVPALDAPGFVPGANLERNVESAATELSRFRENDKPAYGVDPNNRFGPPVRILPEAEEEKQRRQRLDAAAGLVDNAMNVAGPVTAPMIAAGGPLAALKAGAGIAAGYGASEGGGALVHGKVSPEEEHAVRTALFFLPSLAGTVAGLKTTAGRTPEGGRAAGATILGGKAGVGVRSTPEAFEGAVKVGDTRIGARISRNGGAPAPAEAPAPAAPLPAGVTSMVKANAAEAMAKNVVAGRPAVPPAPAPPPTPSQQFGNKLDGSHIDTMAQIIAAHPPAERDALIDEAHQNISRWIADNGKVLVDGQIHIARNPEQADTLAAKLVNAAVAKHDKAAAEATPPPAAASSPVPTSAPAPAIQQFIRSTRPTRKPAPAPSQGAQQEVAPQAAVADQASTNPQTGRKVGDVVSVGGKRIEITKILPGGKYEGTPAANAKPAAALPVSAGKQPTSQNLTGNEGSRGEAIQPSPSESIAKPEPSAPAVAQRSAPPAALQGEHGPIDVQMNFAPPEEKGPAWKRASENKNLHQQFARLGIPGFSIDEPHKFGLSEQANINPHDGKMSVNAAAEDPEHSIAHELAHDIYKRLPAEPKAEVDRFIENNKSGIYPGHGGGHEERVADYFADVMAGREQPPQAVHKAFFESKLGARPARPARALPESAPTHEERAPHQSWDDAAKHGGTISQTDDLDAMVARHGDFPLVIKDTFGARHVAPASVVAKLAKTPAEGYIHSVYLAADQTASQPTARLKEELSKNQGMLEANGYIGQGNKPDPSKPLRPEYRDELKQRNRAIETELSEREKGAKPRAVAQGHAGRFVIDSNSGATPLTRALATAKNAHALNPSHEAEAPSRYTEAVQITKEHGSASVSLLQRRLKIGYEEAAHLVNRMSDEGLVEAANGPRPRPVIGKAAQAITKRDIQPAHEYASTQVNIEPKSELGKRHAEAVAAMPDEHIGPNGKEETPHVTVRYGLKDDSPEAIEKIKAAAAKIAPFEATVGKTGSFPATKEGDRPIIAQVEKSPELNALRSAVEGAGEFKPDDHGEYKPHITLGYVKPEHVAKYEGGNHLEGGKVPVDHIVVTKKDRTQEVIKLGSQPERREPGNAALREKLKGMSPADKDRAIEEYHNRERTSEKTGLPNYLAFEESADTLGKTHGTVGYTDVDDFKLANHVLGHYGVDKKVLPMLGDIMRQAEARENGAVKIFHRSGDEFLMRATDPAAVGRVMADVNEALKTAKFEIEKPDGKLVTHDGIGLSHGTGESEQAAEYNADNGTHPGSKPSRKKSGQRTGSRDADAQSLVAHDTAGQQSHQDHTPERQGLLGDLGGSSEAAEGIARPAASLKPGEASVVPTAELHADPERFQYKGGTDEQGVTNALKDQQVYDQNKGGVLLVWKDPANGKVYVVNGHHRFELAKRAGEKTVLVRMIEAPNAEAAKVVGAETNISEGHGSLVDAARFFKAAGIKTARDAMNRNLPLGQAKVTDGLAMAKLDNSILDKVESGDIPEGRAVAIGSVTENAAQQDAVLQAIAKRESRSGKPVNNGEAESIARQVRDADSHIEQGQDLFGAFSHEQSLYGEQAEIDDYVLKQLSADKRTFGAVASKTRAETLGKVKDQQINQAENQRISEQAAQAGELYTKLVNSPGPLNDIRKNAAKTLASRYGKPQDIKAKAYAAVREQLQKSMSGDGPAYSLESIDELREWARAAGGRLKIEDMGDQGIMFGGTEKMYRLSTSKESSVAVTQSQLDALKEQIPSLAAKLPKDENDIRHDFAPIPFRAQAGLFGTEGRAQPILTVSRAAAKLIGATDQFAGLRLGTSFKGASLSATQARMTANELTRTATRLPEDKGAKLEAIARDLHKAADQAALRGVAVVVEGSAPNIEGEELFHGAQRELGKGELRHLPDAAVDRLMNHPVAQKLKPELSAMGYDGTNPHLMVAEIAAKIASDENLLSPDEAGAWFSRYLDELNKAHGEQKVADVARTLAGHAQEVYEDAKRRIAQAQATQPGPESRSGRNPEVDGGLRERQSGEPAESSDRRNQKNAGGKGTQGQLDQPFLLSREHPPSKGDTITLKGGQVGTAKYIDPEMGVVRVQLASGTTKTFPLRDVVSSSNRAGEAGFARMDTPASIAKAALRYLLEPSDETKVALSVDDRLFQLDRQYEADVLRAKKLLDSATTSPEDQEAIYHHIENPNEPVTPAQQRFYKDFIEPLTEASREMRNNLNDVGIPVGEAPEGYIHRVVQGRTSQLGRVASGQKGGTGKGNVLSKYASSLQRRQMFAAERTGNEQLPLSDERPGPNRIVVHRGDGKITGFQNGEAFEFAKDKPGLDVGDDFKDKDGDEWTLLQATTKEIEQHTNLVYYKNALATSIADYLQLRRAERANDALEALKEDPDFQRMAFKSDRGNRGPDGWKPTTLPQFQGWLFEPHTAEVLQRYSNIMYGDPYTWLDRVGNFLTASLLLNPTKHILNIGNHWLVERGASGNLNPLRLPKAIQAGVRAMKAALTQNEDFLNALDQGAPMMSHRQDLQQLHQKLYELLLDHLESDHAARDKVAQFVGLTPQGVTDKGITSAVIRASGLRLLNNMRLLGQRTMWLSNDIFMLQSAYEKQLRDPNLSFKDAMAQVARHIPDYRVPDRVLNQKWLGDMMRNPSMTIFSRYHYGVLKSYGEMIRETLSPDVTAADRMRGLDHLAMLLITTSLLYWLAERATKKLTGDPNAKLTRSGASAVPSAIAQVAEGHRPPGDLITGTLTPSPLLKTGAELATNRDFYSGGKVYDEHDTNSNILKDIGGHVASALGPVQQYKSASYKDHPTRDFLFSQIGVTFPKYETQTPAQRLMHDLLRENMPPLGPEQRRELDDKRARIASGQLTDKEREALLKKQTLSEFQIYLPHLRYLYVKRVYDAATPDEKKIIRPIMLDKADRLMRSNPMEGQREGALDAFNEK